jgi:oxygen-independent coproporphyrinogen-3 oxidase
MKTETEPMHAVVIDEDLIRRYDAAGPRYTSYPTAVQFHDGFSEEDYRRAAADSNTTGGPLSLYFHLPFCNTVCYYCGCNKIVTKDRSRAAPYLARLEREIEMQSQLFDGSRMVDQLHWGGGTPTFISHDEMRALMEQTRRHFPLRDDDGGEYSLEIDPREIRPGTLELLRELGFNRVSMGVQDFDPRVQEAVNRIQPRPQTLAVLGQARALGFRSINMDLIYGLPFQTVDSFGATLEQVIDASPDRLSVFNYAHLPERFKPQRRIRAEDLPPPAEKLEILKTTIAMLTDAGYVYIGMDHFARPDDELAVAQRDGSLTRNFQGYSTHGECDLVAMGITAIGRIANAYSQNARTLDDYHGAIDSGHLPIIRGLELSADDVLRRAVINRLICHFRLEYAPVEREFGIRFTDYFGSELESLQAMAGDGLLRLLPDRIEVLPVGKLLIRNICMVFDAYLDRKAQYSRVI